MPNLNNEGDIWDCVTTGDGARFDFIETKNEFKFVIWEETQSFRENGYIPAAEINFDKKNTRFLKEFISRIHERLNK
jgi:hypothetical protein